jgi:putative PIN family toxin of toxin-antitoxin system
VKVVLDTNVFVSGVFFHGPPYQILQAWRDQKIELIVSPEIFAEYQKVGEILAEEHPAINLTPILEYVLQNASVYAAAALPNSVCEDPDDDKFLACALASGGIIVVSGDKHLLKVSGYQGIEVLKPREFVERHLA